MFGPGKAELLSLIAETGSIAAAGRRLGMSYKRAWVLVDTMNTTFAEPLVARSRGGASHGGANLTKTGMRVLALYRNIEAEARATCAADLQQM
ncbi:MAG: winged helix-turn-helix domain-containing protein, partial [Hyphomicrobiaceae bacterium]